MSKERASIFRTGWYKCNQEGTGTTSVPTCDAWQAPWTIDKATMEISTQVPDVPKTETMWSNQGTGMC